MGPVIGRAGAGTVRSNVFRMRPVERENFPDSVVSRPVKRAASIRGACGSGLPGMGRAEVEVAVSHHVLRKQQRFEKTKLPG